MSNFYLTTYNPETGKEEVAEWLDNYFGPRRYGVRFPDGKVYRPGQCKAGRSDYVSVSEKRKRKEQDKEAKQAHRYNEMWPEKRDENL